MNLVIRARKAASQTVSVQLDAAEVTGYLQSFYLSAARRAGLHPEPGLTARQLVERELDPDEVGRAASEEVAVRATPLVLDQAGIDAVGAADYGCHGYAREGEPFAFDVVATLKPAMELDSYGPVPLPAWRREVDEANVDEFVARVVAFHSANAAAGEGGCGAKIDDEWVARTVAGCASVAQMRERARRELQEEADRNALDYARYRAADVLAGRLEGPVPDEAFAACYAEALQGLRRTLAEQGTTEQEFLREKGLQPDELRCRLMSQVRNRLRQELALDALARHEGMRLSRADLDGYLDGVSGGQHARLRQELEENGGMRKAKEEALRAKANDWLVRTALVEELPETA